MKVEDQEVESQKGNGWIKKQKVRKESGGSRSRKLERKVEDQEVESQKGKWRIKKQKARKESEGSRSKSGSILFERKVIYKLQLQRKSFLVIGNKKRINFREKIQKISTVIWQTKDLKSIYLNI